MRKRQYYQLRLDARQRGLVYHYGDCMIAATNCYRATHLFGRGYYFGLLAMLRKQKPGYGVENIARQLCAARSVAGFSLP